MHLYRCTTLYPLLPTILASSTFSGLFGSTTPSSPLLLSVAPSLSPATLIHQPRRPPPAASLTWRVHHHDTSWARTSRPVSFPRAPAWPSQRAGAAAVTTASAHTWRYARTACRRGVSPRTGCPRCSLRRRPASPCRSGRCRRRRRRGGSEGLAGGAWCEG
jgi:hypothetical protein